MSRPILRGGLPGLTHFGNTAKVHPNRCAEKPQVDRVRSGIEGVGIHAKCTLLSGLPQQFSRDNTRAITTTTSRSVVSLVGFYYSMLFDGGDILIVWFRDRGCSGSAYSVSTLKHPNDAKDYS